MVSEKEDHELQSSVSNASASVSLNNSSSVSYSMVAQMKQFPKKEQGLLMDCVEGFSLTDYVCAIGEIVKPINILNASKISNNRVRLYISSKEILAELTVLTLQFVPSLRNNKELSFPMFVPPSLTLCLNLKSSTI